MKKAEFVDRVWTRNSEKGSNISKTNIKWWLDFLLSELADAVLDEGSVMLSGFGTFEKMPVKGREMYNFDREIIDVPDHYKLKFKPSITLRQAVRDGMDAKGYADWLHITAALRHGKDVPGWELKGHIAVKKAEYE